jgi:ADP-ribose pyrophosphatase
MQNNHHLEQWKTISSKYVINDRWLKLRVDSCITPDGHTMDPYYVMEYGEWANCVVLTEENEVMLLRHYRHGVKKTVLEIVGCRVDEGETPEQAMRRELEEELGLVNSTIEQTGVCYANPSSQTNNNYCYLSIGGTLDGSKVSEPGAYFEILRMPLADLLKKVEDGSEVFQSLHLASILFALPRLKQMALTP